MTKENRIMFISVAVMTVLFSLAVVASISSFGTSPKEIVRKFWQFNLENKMNEAKSLTASESELASVEPRKAYGVGNGTGADGKEIDHFYQEQIYREQIKIDRVTEFKKKNYRAGVRLETTDKKDYKSEYIVCLGELRQTPTLWRITRVTLSHVFKEPKKIEDECFEGAPLDKS